jgi:heptosyltransferase-1
VTISPDNNYKNILIVKLSAIGDVIHALPVAHALKQHFPLARITWVVEKSAYDLLCNNPDIDEIIIFDKPKFKSISGLIKYAPDFSRMLKVHQFNLALDLQGLFKSAAITALSGAKQRLGYCNMRELSQWISAPVCGKNSDGHIVERYLDVARAVGCEVSEVLFPLNITAEEAARASSAVKQAGLPTGQSYAILAPGTNWPSKCWPAGHFAQLANELNQAGIIPVIIGGPGDAPLAAQIIAKAPKAINLTGKTTLKELAYIIKNANFFVGGDTGPMHLAVAVQTTVIALFGPTDPKRNGPYGQGHIVLTVQDDCRKCWKRQCPDGKQCMAGIAVSEVMRAVRCLQSKADINIET